MRIPLWDSFLFGAEVFTALLPSIRLLYLAGNYGSGKTVLATFLAGYLKYKGLTARTHTNIEVLGAEAVDQVVPPGQRYFSRYLERWFEAGERLPIEDACLLLDEASLFLDNWQDAKNYVAALRKTNCYLLMPSIWNPVPRLKMFEVRRTMNLYVFNVPAWIYTWHMTNGRTVGERGRFWLWRPHRLFGISKTTGFPSDDGGICEGLEYTFNISKLREFKTKQKVTRAGSARTVTLGGSESYGADGGWIDDAISNAESIIDQQFAFAKSFNGKKS